LDLLWREYKEQHPDGYQYSQFCWLYRSWQKKLDYSMRQDHRGGEKLFVDYGEGLKLVDPKTGELVGTQLFVAVWGASNYTYAEATLTQQLPDWIGSHVRAFAYFGCVPKGVVPDCLKGAVSKACRYEPEINPSYAEMAEHYGICVLPARPARPRDKAKVETGVLIAKRWILAALRHRTFYSLTDLNAAIQQLLERLNTRALRKVKKSRRELFALFDRPQAQPLPDNPYEYAEWRVAKVNIDYHIEVERHYYSVPFRLIRENSMSGLPPRPWKPLLKANASRLTSEALFRMGTPHEKNTCRPRIKSTWNGLPQESLAGPKRSVPIPPSWSKPSSTAVPIPSRLIAPA
jgi:transposase